MCMRVWFPWMTRFPGSMSLWRRGNVGGCVFFKVFFFTAHRPYQGAEWARSIWKAPKTDTDIMTDEHTMKGNTTPFPNFFSRINSTSKSWCVLSVFASLIKITLTSLEILHHFFFTSFALFSASLLFLPLIFTSCLFLMTASFHWLCQWRGLLNDSQAVFTERRQTSNSQHLVKWMGSPLICCVLGNNTNTGTSITGLFPFPDVVFIILGGARQAPDRPVPWITLIMWMTWDDVLACLIAGSFGKMLFLFKLLVFSALWQRQADEWFPSSNDNVPFTQFLSVSSSASNYSPVSSSIQCLSVLF